MPELIILLFLSLEQSLPLRGHMLVSSSEPVSKVRLSALDHNHSYLVISKVLLFSMLACLLCQILHLVIWASRVLNRISGNAELRWIQRAVKAAFSKNVVH